eukprot:2438926-Pyramimonas_sp.AAC.1
MSTSAHVILMQEHHLVYDRVNEASQWASRRGWRPLWGPASPGEGNGSYGGVAIFTRAFLGLHENKGLSWNEPSRIISGIVCIPGGIDSGAT